LVIIGLIFNFVYVGGVIGQIFIWCGIGFFGLAVLINLVTLPVEYNASGRAIRILESTGYLNSQELPGCKEVLNAAALTYVAALLVAILNLLRFVLVFSRRD
jgi:Zn-dependent membrane protease YugP